MVKFLLRPQVASAARPPFLQHTYLSRAARKIKVRPFLPLWWPQARLFTVKFRQGSPIGRLGFSSILLPKMQHNSALRKRVLSALSNQYHLPKLYFRQVCTQTAMGRRRPRPSSRHRRSGGSFSAGKQKWRRLPMERSRET